MKVKSLKLDEQYKINFNRPFFENCKELLSKFHTKICNYTLDYNYIFEKYNFKISEDKGVHTNFPIIVIYTTQFIFSLIKYLFYQHLYSIYNYSKEIDNEQKLTEEYTKSKSKSKSKLDTESYYMTLKMIIDKKILLLEDILNISNNIKYNNSDINKFNESLDEIDLKKKIPILIQLRSILKKSNVLRSNYDYSKSIVDLIDYITKLVSYKPSKSRINIDAYKLLVINICKQIASICTNLNIKKIIHITQIAKLLESRSIIDILNFNEKIKANEEWSPQEKDEFTTEDKYKEINFSKLIYEKLDNEKFKDTRSISAVIDIFKQHIINIIYINQSSSSSKFIIEDFEYIFAELDSAYSYKNAEGSLFHIFDLSENARQFHRNYKGHLELMVGGAPPFYNITRFPEYREPSVVANLEEPIYEDLDIQTKLPKKVKTREDPLKKIIAKHIHNISQVEQFQIPEGLIINLIDELYFKSSFLSADKDLYIFKNLFYYFPFGSIVSNSNLVKTVITFYIKVFLPSLISMENIIIDNIDLINNNSLLSIYLTSDFMDVIKKDNEIFNSTIVTRIKYADIIDDDYDDTVQKGEFIKIFDLDFLNKFIIGYNNIKFEPRVQKDKQHELYTAYISILQLNRDALTPQFIDNLGKRWHMHLMVFLKLINRIKINKVKIDKDTELIKTGINTRFDEITSIYTLTLPEVLAKIRQPLKILSYDKNNILKAITKDFGFVFQPIENDQNFENFIVEISDYFFKNYHSCYSLKFSVISDLSLYPDLDIILRKYYSNIDEIIADSNIYRKENSIPLSIKQHELGGRAMSSISFTTDKLHSDKLHSDKHINPTKTLINKKKILKGGLKKTEKKGFICHVNFIEIYKQLNYLYENFSENEFFNFKALCYYYDIDIPDNIELDIKELIYFINKHFIERYFIIRQDKIYLTIVKKLETCNFDRFLEYFDLYLEIKKYSDVVKKLEENIASIENTADDEFKENIEQLYITSESLDYYIERPIYSLYGKISSLHCSDRQSLEYIIQSYTNSEKYAQKLDDLYNFGVKASDLDNIIKGHDPIQQTELQVNLDLFERFMHDYKQSKL